MRSGVFACLASLALVSPALPQSAAVVRQDLPDGITVRAVGYGGELRKHGLVVYVRDELSGEPQIGVAYRPIFDETREPQRRETILVRQKAIYEALEALGLKRDKTPAVGSAYGGYGGSSGATESISEVRFLVPDGPCDGETVSGVSRRKLVEAAMKAGAARLVLFSMLDGAHAVEHRRAADEDAVRAGRAEAGNIARAGGAKVGKLLAAQRVEPYSGPAVRVLNLMADGVRRDGGSGLYPSAFLLRFAIK